MCVICGRVLGFLFHYIGIGCWLMHYDEHRLGVHRETLKPSMVERQKPQLYTFAHIDKMLLELLDWFNWRS